MSKFCRYKIEQQLFPTETYAHENLSLSLDAKVFQDESMLTWLVGQMEQITNRLFDLLLPPDVFKLSRTPSPNGIVNPVEKKFGFAIPF